MPEMHLKQPGFTYSACGPFTKIKERIKNLKKHGILDTFIKMNQMKLVVNMIWLVEILKIKVEEQLLIKYCTIKIFNIAKNLKYDGYQRRLASMVYKFLVRKLLLEQLKMKLYLIENQQKNCRNQLLEKLRKEKYTHLLHTIFGAQTQQICN